MSDASVINIPVRLTNGSGIRFSSVPSPSEVTVRLVSSSTCTARLAEPLQYLEKTLTRKLEKYDLVEKLGEGTCGQVYLAKRYETVRGQRVKTGTCAIKVMRRSDERGANDYLAMNEAMILKKLKRSGHTGIIQMEESMGDGINRYIVLELAAGGSLLDNMERRGLLDPSYVRSIAADLLLTLMFLKKHNIVHRDIKPENILLSARGRPILADFGIAVNLGKGGKVKGLCGTPGYIAPEVIFDEEYSYPVDAFSYGCVLYECLVGYPPFDGEDLAVMDYKTVNEEVTFPGGAWLDFYTKHFIRTLLEKSPDRRVTLEDAQDSAYMEGIDWSRVESGNYDVPPDWMPSDGCTDVLDTIIDKEGLLDESAGPAPLFVDMEDEYEFTTELDPDAGHRARDDARRMQRPYEPGSCRDAVLLFMMPEDDNSHFEIEWRGEIASGFAFSSPDTPKASPAAPRLPDVSFFEDVKSLTCTPDFTSDELGPDSLLNSARYASHDLQSILETCKRPPSPLPRIVPDLLGEIPDNLDEKDLREAEAALTRLREAAVERGLRGLGLKGIPELAMYMTAESLLLSPKTHAERWAKRRLTSEVEFQYLVKIPLTSPEDDANETPRIANETPRMPFTERLRQAADSLKRTIGQWLGFGSYGRC